MPSFTSFNEFNRTRQGRRVRPDAEGWSRSLCDRRALTVMRSNFANLLDSVQLKDAARDFTLAMGDVASTLNEADSAMAAEKVHALITYAIVFGFGELAQYCRAFEAAVADGHGVELCRDRLAEAIQRSLLGRQHAFSGEA